MPFVQAAGNDTPVSNQLIQAFGSNVGNNTVLLALVSRDAVGAPTLGGIADTLANGWNTTPIEEVDDIATTGEKVSVYWAPCPVGGANTVTVSYTSVPGDGCIIVAEFSLRDTVNPTSAGKHTKATQASPGTGADGISCGPITAVAGDDLMMFMVDVGAIRSNTFSQGSGYTEKLEVSNGTGLDAMLQVLENVSGGSLTGTATTANNDRIVSILVALTSSTPPVVAPGALPRTYQTRTWDL